MPADRAGGADAAEGLEDTPTATCGPRGAAGASGVQEETRGLEQGVGATESCPGTSRGRKRRKDGEFKKSGLREGERRGTPRSLHFKYEVVQHLRGLQKLQKIGLSDYPNDETAEKYHVTKGQVSTWQKQESSLKAALQHGNQARGRGKHARHAEKIIHFNSRAARKLSLHPGRSQRKFAAAEAEVFASYKQRRSKGLRVSGQWLRIHMKRVVFRHYGSDSAADFKASKKWLGAFCRYYNISMRRRTNKKHVSIGERVHKCKRWHSRFRRRLKGGPRNKLDPKWGRWLPQNRISVDQVPCNLCEGGAQTYADLGEKRVWIVGSKADSGKRFCTLQVAARCANGSATEPRCGQPKLTVVFRGQGKRISAEEKAAWHPEVKVRFQEKAWFNDELCEAYAKEEVKEITAAARIQGDESVLILDNLSGQTTDMHKKILAKARCVLSSAC